MNLKSEVLFNRALLWLLMCTVVMGRDGHDLLGFSYMMLALYNFWKSWKTWEVDA